jgi:putative hemolysin
MSPYPLILTATLLVVTVLISAAVSALETALFCLKEHHVAALGGSRPATAGIMRAIARQPRRSLHQILFLGSLLNLALAVLGLLLLRQVEPILPDRPLSSAMGLFGALVVVAELIPSLIALAAPARVFQVTVTPFIRLSPLLARLSDPLEAVTARLSERLTPAYLKPRQKLTDDEIETLVEMRRDQGVLAPSESEIIQEIIRLGNKTAKDCMTPRVDTFMLSDRLENGATMERLRESPEWHWFVPVYQGSPDLVIGVLDVKRWLFDPEADFRSCTDPPVFIPEMMNALEAFRDYLSSPRSLAVILDEYGGVEGVLTHADIIEEILADAAPALDQEDEIEILGPGRIRADGDARLDEIADALDLDLDYEGLDTIGGLVFNETGQVPPPGTKVVIGEMRITIRRSLRQRITAVEIERIEKTEDGRTEADGD